MIIPITICMIFLCFSYNINIPEKPVDLYEIPDSVFPVGYKRGFYPTYFNEKILEEID
jgi:hypothetical protein